MRESTIERAVCAKARKLGFYVSKFERSRSGAPDRFFLTKTGHVFFVEFKAPNKKPRPLQLREHALLRERNVDVYVIDSMLEGLALIDKKNTFKP